MLEPLTARDRFTEIRACVLELARMEARLDDLRQSQGPKGQTFDSVGHGSGAKDASAPVLALIQAEIDFERFRAKTNAEIDKALEVLYGKDNRGGIAKIRNSTTADMICGYYLQGMTWPEVSQAYGWPESRDGPQYCKRRAYRALADVDRLGWEYVTNV